MSDEAMQGVMDAGQQRGLLSCICVESFELLDFDLGVVEPVLDSEEFVVGLLLERFETLEIVAECVETCFNVIGGHDAQFLEAFDDVGAHRARFTVDCAVHIVVCVHVVELKFRRKDLEQA